jgi:hypothetical protein
MKYILAIAMILLAGCSGPISGGKRVSLKENMTDTEWLIKVAAGEVSGYSSINKFGHNPTVETGTDPEDVWQGGGIYGFVPTESVTCDIKSDDTDDAAAGTGARTVIVYGLDTNWLEVNETVTLNGTTEVALQNEYVRLYRAVVLTAGSQMENDGNITVQSSEGAGGINDNTVGIYIAAEDGQSQQAWYTIPAGKTGYFMKGYVGVSDGGNAASRESAEFKWKARLNNGTTGAWATKGQVECINDGSTTWQYRYGIPAGPLPAKTDIRIECTEVTATLGVVGGFDILLVDN